MMDNERGMNRRELADELGISVTALYNWEQTGVMVPAIKTKDFYGRNYYSMEQVKQAHQIIEQRKAKTEARQQKKIAEQSEKYYSAVEMEKKTGVSRAILKKLDNNNMFKPAKYSKKDAPRYSEDQVEALLAFMNVYKTDKHCVYIGKDADGNHIIKNNDAFTVKTFADAVGVERYNVKKWIADGKIETHEIYDTDSRYVFTADQLEEGMQLKGMICNRKNRIDCDENCTAKHMAKLLDIRYENFLKAMKAGGITGYKRSGKAVVFNISDKDKVRESYDIYLKNHKEEIERRRIEKKEQRMKK